MATDTLQTQPLPAIPGREIHDLATEGQSRSSRIRSLADAIRTAADDTCSEADFERRRNTLNRIIDFAELIEREGEDLIQMGERIEMLSRRVVAEKV